MLLRAAGCSDNLQSLNLEVSAFTCATYCMETLTFVCGSHCLFVVINQQVVNIIKLEDSVKIKGSWYCMNRPCFPFCKCLFMQGCQFVPGDLSDPIHTFDPDNPNGTYKLDLSRTIPPEQQNPCILARTAA